MLKDDTEHSVPESWRGVFRQIATAFARGDYQLRQHSLHEVMPVSAETAALIAANVSAYGDTLVPLNEATWERSVYRWMDGYWLMLVDLTTAGESVSDLTLHAKVHETDSPCLEIDSVHVP